MLKYQEKWYKCLSLVEFSYNNNYQENLKMLPFEALYGRRCHTPLNWIEPSERTIFGPNLVTETKEIVPCIQSNLKAAKSRQESYANKRCQPLEFEAGDRVYLHVSHMRGKLAPRYISPFPILSMLVVVAYWLELLSSLVGMHNIFHVSQLKKYLKAHADVPHR
jgi:hypothetical protein